MKMTSKKGSELAAVLTRMSLWLALIGGPLLLDWQLNRAGLVREDIAQVHKTPPGGALPTQQATVVTDKNEYSPNSTAYFMGVGFLPGETIDLVVTRTDWNKFQDAEFHTGSVIANSDGEFFCEWSVCAGPCLGAELMLVADAETSGKIASTTFRDGAVLPAAPSSPAGPVEPSAGTVLLSQSQIPAEPAQVTGASQKSSDSTSGGRLTAMAVTSYDTFFQLDGNVVTAGGTGLHDWDQVYSDLTSSSTVSGSTAISFFNDPVPVTVPGVGPLTEDTYTGGNSKDIYDLSSWTYDSSGPQNKANLENAIAAAYLDPNNANHTYLYVAADRYDNAGAMALGVWFLQTPVGQKNGKFYELDSNGNPDTTRPAHHVDGDLLLVADFKSGAATITSFKWTGGANGGIPSTGTTLSADIGKAVVNTVAIQVPWPYRSSASGAAAASVQTGEFFEAGVDLNKLFPNQTTFNFSSFIVETRASTSPTATLSDFIVGHVSTAPDVTITKWADGSPRAGNPANEALSPDVTIDSGTTAGFTVKIENIGVGNLNNVTLNDPLPSIAGMNWVIDSDPSGNFEITGTAPNQSLKLKAGAILVNNSAPITVHISSSTPGAATLVNEATVGADNEAAAFKSNNKATATITVIGGGITPANVQDAVEGVSKSILMGSFTSATGGTWNGSINWGDGSPAETFTLANTANVPTTIPARSHTYWEEKQYEVTITLTLGAITKTGDFFVNVADQPVVAAGISTINRMYTGYALGNAAGNPSGTVTIATFKDPGGAEPKPVIDTAALNEQYTATVDWGTGFANNDPATIAFTGAPYGANVPPYNTSDNFTVSASIPYKNVGTYSASITIVHEDTTPQIVPLTVVIAKAPLTVTADADPSTVAKEAFSKPYDGTAFTAFTVRYAGFLGSDGPSSLAGTLGFSGPATTAVNAGGPYTVTPGGLTSLNYNITFIDGTLNITKVPLSVTADSNPNTPAIDAFSKTFDEAVYSPFIVRYSGFVNGENQSVLGGSLGFSGPGTTATAAGGPYTVTPNGLTSGNYTISFVDGLLNITTAHLVVTVDDKEINEGDPVPTLTYTVTLNGQSMPANTVTGTLTTTATGTSAPTTSPNQLTHYPITASVPFTAANYDVEFHAGKLTVLDVAPTITMSKGTINLNVDDGFSRPGSFTDPGFVVTTETWTITADYGDGTVSGPTPISKSPGTFLLDHVYTGIGNYTVEVTIADNYGKSSKRSFTVSVTAKDLTQ